MRKRARFARCVRNFRIGRMPRKEVCFTLKNGSSQAWPFRSEKCRYCCKSLFEVTNENF